MNPIKNIVIVGGGTAGWMAAASLQQHFKNLVNITLIESTEIGTIGVGEATIPTIREFYHRLGMNDLDVMRATNATCKLGIQFNDWHTISSESKGSDSKASQFIHPFGLYGQALDGIEFQHFWLKLKQKNLVGELGDYSLGVTLARNNKFTIPVKNPSSTLSVFDWALHFDATLFAKLMRTYAEENGTTRIDAKVTQVNLREHDGFIESLLLDTGDTITGDLFIDCSGFRGLLIEGALKTGYENWSHWLLCDTAFAVQSETTSAPNSYTNITARPAGWQWKIPLQHRNGNGHVFSSRFMDDEQARTLLINNVNEKLLHEPRKISFTPGRRKQAWNKNCIALGLAAGFLEPLESTSIALIETGIEKIKMLFPDMSFRQSVIDEFNEITALEYDRVRDFILLHYKLSARDDSDFWRYCRAMEVPDTLKHKMELFKASGYVVRYRWEMFHLPSWLAIFTGFNYLPETYNRAVDNFDEQRLVASFKKMQQSLLTASADAYDHADFIAKYCAAKK